MAARRKLQPINAGANGIPPIIRALRREVAINIDGTVYNICFDYNVLCELEVLLGTDQIRDIYKTMGEGKLPPFSYTRACLYACLKHAGAPYTLEQVGSFMHYGSLAAINEALFAAQRASLAEEVEEDENPTIAAAAQ